MTLNMFERIESLNILNEQEKQIIAMREKLSTSIICYRYRHLLDAEIIESANRIIKKADLPRVSITDDLKVTLNTRLSDSKKFFVYKEIIKNRPGSEYLGAPSYAWQIKEESLEMIKTLLTIEGFLIEVCPDFDAQIKMEYYDNQCLINKTVTVRYSDNKIRFKCGAKSQKYNDIFNNRSGLLTGVTEYLEDTFERSTVSFSLAQEAISVLQESGFIIILDESYQYSLAAYIEQQKAFENQDQVITSKLDKQYKLFNHQNKAVDFIEKTAGKCLLGACMGSGKSLMTLAYAAKYNLRVCVVCPKVVVRTWVQEARKFFPTVFTNCVELTKKNLKQKATDFQLVSINYESLKTFEEWIESGNFDILVIDESHYIKNFKSARTKRLLHFSEKFPKKILLSGTAIKNDRYELHPQLQLIDPKTYQEECALFTMPVGKFWHSIQDIYLSMPKSEVLSFLPPQIINRQDHDVSEPVGLPSTIEEIQLYRHNCARSKINISVNKIKDILENSDEYILFFSEFVDICCAVAQYFKDNSTYHDGSMKNEMREQAKHKFQNGEGGRIFISTRPSLAVGATLTRASQVIFNDLPWNAADIQQAQDRAHRIGQNRATQVHWLIAANSDFDCKLIEIIERKYRIQKALTEGKQLSPEEMDTLKKPITLADFITAR